MRNTFMLKLGEESQTRFLAELQLDVRWQNAAS